MSDRLRNILAGVVSLAVFASVLAFALTADGREASRATSNDGGAWLVDRSRGGSAHVEYTTRQPTVSALQVAEPGSALSAIQSPGIVLLYDRSASTVKVLDGGTASQVSTTSVPVGSVVKSLPGGAVVFDAERSQLWRLTRGELTGSEEIATLSPMYVGTEPGRVLVGIEGTTAIVEGSQVLWPSADLEEPGSVPLPTDFEPDFATMAATQAVLVDGDSWFVATASGGSLIELDRQVSVLAIQREAASWPRVGVTTTEGDVVYVDVSNGSVIDVGEGVDAAQTGQLPINHEGCVHTLGGTSGSIDFAVLCDDGRRELYAGLDLTTEAELRLVNGEVWIDALDGSGFLLTPELELQDVADFSEIFDNSDGNEDADGDQVEERLDQAAENAGLTDADRLDPTLDNVPPIAEDDEAATRLGRSAVVDVLRNDTDANGDVILVTSVEVLDGGDIAVVAIPTTADSVQVSPTGLPGTVRFRYTIDDGNGGTDSAIVEVQILPVTQEENRPPTALLDRVVASAGTTVTANLLENDFDPDGDSIQLLSIGQADGVTVLSTHPDGTVNLALPPTVDTAEIEIPYVVVDEWQAEQEGALRITLRLEDANSPPDARNDAGSTQVDRSISIPLLANDVDADNDPLSIAIEPRLVDGSEIPGFASTTDDGEFLFRPSEAGIFIFEYAATDLSGSDLALVRIEVTEAVANRPPIAVRDDATLALNETRVVRALENDGDPDGDLFGFSDIGANPNLDIVPIPGVGFSITMGSNAGRVEVFSYRISDGEFESEPTQVVVTRSDQVFENAPPIVQPDTIRVRAGRTSRAFVLRNDVDPEGLPLTVIAVDAPDGIDVSIGGNGAWVEVRPPVDQSLPFTFQYTAADSTDQVAAASVQVVIVREEEPNTPPTARTDVAYTFESQPISVNVLANDSDPESDGISVIAVPSAPGHGSAIVEADGATITYTPADGFTGTDEFTYLLTDTEGAEAVGLVRIAVLASPNTNRPPIAGDDLDLGPFPADGTQVPLDVLLNDIDPDGDPITVTEIVTEGLSEVSIVNSGTALGYQLPTEVSGPVTVSFVYRIGDGRLGTDEATVQFTIEPTVEPVPPIANPDVSDPVSEGESVTVDVLANDTDPDGEDTELRVIGIEGGPTGSEFSDRTISVVAPAESFEVRYTIVDADGLEASSFLTVEVKENLPPQVQANIVLGPFFTDEQIPQINLADFVDDPDNALEELTFSGVSGPAGGTTVLDESSRDGRLVTFQPSPDFDGDGGFSFRVQDPAGNLVSGFVTIRLQGPSNQPPVGFDQVLQIEAGIDLSLDVSTLFEDPNSNQQLTYEVVEQPGNQLTLSGGVPNLTLDVPVTAPAGQTSFALEATDPEGETARAIVTVNIAETEQGPPLTGVLPEIEINQGESATFRPLDAATDTLGTGALQVTSAVALDPTAGSVSFDGQTFTFEAAGSFSGTTSIAYTIADDREGADGEASGTATVVVIGRPESPSSVQASAVGPTNVSLTWTVPADNGGPIQGYQIVVNGNDVVEHDSTNPTYRFDDLTPGVEYFFQVIALNQAGSSDPSAVSSPVTPDEVPGPPGQPTASFVPGEPGSVLLNWASSENRGSAITSQFVEVSLCASGVEEIGPGTSFTWTGLPDGQPCSFRVTARNQAGDSIPSTNSATECAVAEPGAPSQPNVLRGDKEATLTWLSPTNPDCEALAGYEIIRYLRGAEDGRTSVPAGTTSWTSSPLLNGETYSFEVVAANRQGQGPASARSNEIIPCGVPLLQSVPPTVDPQDGRVAIEPPGIPDGNGCEATQFMMRINGGSQQALPFTQGFVDGLVNGTSYTFSLAGVNEIGVGEFGPESAAVVPFGPPGVPNVSATRPGDNTFEVTFAGADGNGRPIDSYDFSGPGSVVQSNANELVLLCINNLGNPCIPQIAGQQTPTTPCLQNPESVTIEGWATTVEGGVGDRATWTIALSGCPSQPNIGLEDLEDGGQYRVTWTRPAGSTIWVERNGNIGSAVSGTSATYSGTVNNPVSVRIWACNQFGCSSSSTQTVTPTAGVGTVSIGIGNPDPGGECWSAASISAAGGDPNQGCYVLNIRLEGWSGNQTVRCFSSMNSEIWNQFDSFTAGNGVYQDCSYSQAGRWIHVVVGGGTIQGQTSPLPPTIPEGSAGSGTLGTWPTN